MTIDRYATTARPESRPVPALHNCVAFESFSSLRLHSFHRVGATRRHRGNVVEYGAATTDGEFMLCSMQAKRPGPPDAANEEKMCTQTPIHLLLPDSKHSLSLANS